jgi:type I restriction enzyme, R subunit
LIKQSRSDAVAYEEFLQKAEELVKRLASKNPGGDVPVSLQGNAEAIVIFNNLPDILNIGSSILQEDGPVQREEREKLTIRIDQAMRNDAPARWKGDQPKESIVKNLLYDLLGKNREAMQVMFEIVKQQPGYQ